jgi:hypothetical protein
MYHPAAALRTPAIEAESYADVARIPGVLLEARDRRAAAHRAARLAARPATTDGAATDPTLGQADADQLTFF